MLSEKVKGALSDVYLLKQCEIKQKFNETAEMANFTDLPLISCGNGP